MRKLEQTERRRAKVKAELDQHIDKLATALTQGEKLKAKVQRKEAEIAELGEQLGATRDELREHAERIAALEADLASKRETIASLEEALAAEQASVAEWSAKHAELPSCATRCRAVSSGRSLSGCSESDSGAR